MEGIVKQLQSEINLCIVIAALKQLFHFLYADLAGVGAGAGVADGVDSNIVESFQKYVFWNEALIAGEAVRTVILDAVRNVKVIVHLSEISDKVLYLLLVGIAA